MSIKTGGCPEDCKYCSQSIKYNTDVEIEKLNVTTVNLIYTIDRGDRASISEIKFIGNIEYQLPIRFTFSLIYISTVYIVYSFADTKVKCS